MNNGKKALITGIKGFTGHYMAAELSAAGYEISGLGTSPSDTQKNYFSADLTDAKAVKAVVEHVQPDIVVHLAAIAFVGHDDPNAFYNVNIGGTRNLLQALSELEKPPEAVLVASSANVYGNSTAGVLSESLAPNPANDYAVSKLAMEHVARLYSNSLPIIITRPFNYTGVGQANNFLIPKIVTHFRNRSSRIELGNIDVWRDFSDVRYVVRAYAALIEAKAFNHVVNVACGKMHSLREVISLCENITSHSLQIDINPQFVRPNEIKQLCGDTELFQQLVPSPPEEIALDETLRWMLEA